MGIKFAITGREWELNPRHRGNGIGNGNELMGMGGNGNVASHSGTSLFPTATAWAFTANFP